MPPVPPPEAWITRRRAYGFAVIFVEGWIAPAADKGQRFGTTDLLVAGLAHEVGGLVWSLDADLRRMEKLGLVHLYH